MLSLRSIRFGCLIVLSTWGAAGAQREYEKRVHQIRRTPGFVALWDFVKRDNQQFTAHTPKGSAFDYKLDAMNYVRDYWSEGRPATYDDFPLLGRGPFGEAIRIRQESDPLFRPCLLVPRVRLQDSPLDVKGKGRSVSMIVWLVRESGNHAIAGIWHEGTDLKLERAAQAAKIERGQRQYALFAGLAANNGASAAHVSENGAQSFGDRYARNLAVTPEVIPAISANASAAEIDRAWTTVGFTFDNDRDRVTAYLNGEATDYWIDEPQKHPFFRWPAEAWRQAHLRAMEGAQEGEDPAFPVDQFYRPPEDKPLSRVKLESTAERNVELVTYPYTKVRVTRDAGGNVIERELAALRANPYWFPHDLYTPATSSEGGPFTIGRVIHMGRSVGFTGFIGGVAVFDRALSRRQMKRLMSVGREPGNLLRANDVLSLR